MNIKGDIGENRKQGRVPIHPEILSRALLIPGIGGVDGTVPKINLAQMPGNGVKALFSRGSPEPILIFR